MTKEELLKAFNEKKDKVRELLFGAPEPAPVEPVVQAAENTAQLKDGTEIRWTGELAEGTECSIVTAEGVQPAPDGNLELMDGTILTIAGGKVTSITKAAAPAQSTEPSAFEAIETLKTEFNSQIEAIKEAHKLEFEAIKKENEGLKTSLKETFELVELMNHEPGVTIPKPINTFFEEHKKEQESIQEKLIAAKKKVFAQK